MKKFLFALLLSACAAEVDQKVSVEKDAGTPDAPSSVPTAPPVKPQNTKDSGTDAVLVVDAGSDANVQTPLDAGEPVEEAGPPAVRFVGRSYNNSFSWPGSRIIAKFNGSGVKVVLTEKNASQWDVILDEKLNPEPLILKQGTATYTLASGLPKGIHQIELWKRTEASVGTTIFVRFDFDGELLPPPPSPKRRLEFLSDSASNGFGIEGQNPCVFEPDTENEHKAYPALLATALNADHHDLGVSGKGILQNYSRTDKDVFSLLYTRSSAFVASSKWDSAAFQADVVFIVLGGNDYSQVTPDEPPPNREAFEIKYLELVKMVRERQPSAHIFCTIAPSLKDTYPAGYNVYTNMKKTITNVVASMMKSGDSKVYPFEFSRSTGADLTGCVYHPNVAKHQSMAAEALAAIKSKTGW